MTFAAKYGPWGVVAGGSEGLGEAFARELASHGLNLVLVARRKDALEHAAARLRADHGVDVRTIVRDLADKDAADSLIRDTSGLEIGMLVCDAAVTYTGPFLAPDMADYRRMLDVNCASVLGLMHGYGRLMAARARGGIIVMSSMAAFQGSPVVSVYAATKSFLLTLVEGAGDELREVGVDTLACCPAVVRTPHFLSDGHPAGKSVPLSLEPEVVARLAVQALGRKRVLVPGLMGRMAHAMMSRLMPRAAAVSMMGRSTRALYRQVP